MEKQVFLYKAAAGLTKADLKELREAGFIPVKVNEFSDVRVIDSLATGNRSMVFQAAIEAIALHESSGQGPKTLFGARLAKKLMNVDLPDTEAPK